MNRFHRIALLSALSLSACSVEVGGLGDVAVDHVGAADPTQRVPASTTDEPPVVSPAVSDATPDAGAASVDAAANPGDAGTSVTPLPKPDAAVVAAEPDAGSKPVTKPPQPAVDSGVGNVGASDSGADDAGNGPVIPPEPSFVLTSPGFAEGTQIPAKYTCSGADVSPAFDWSGAPAATELFALVLTLRTNVWNTPVNWTRWVIWNIPAKRGGLPAMIEEGHSPESLPGTLQASDESDESSRFGNVGPGGASGAGGSSAGGGFAGGNIAGGGSVAGSSGSGDDKAGRRYRGPCSYGFSQTFEFTLYALAKSPAAPDWYLGISPQEIATWLNTKAKVLGKTSLKGSVP